MTTTTTPLLVRRLTPVQLQMLDGALAILVAAVCWYAAREAPIAPATGWQEPAWVAVLTGIALGAPTALRRSHPLVSAGLVVPVAAVALATQIVPDYAAVAAILAVGLVLYLVGAAVPVRRSAGVAAATVVAVVAATGYAVDSPFGPGAAETAFTALALGSSWAWGWTVRERRAYAARDAERATAKAVDAERLRFAREMHDIVAHSMSLIAVKATIANHVADERPQEMRDALRVIEDTSRAALTELRRTLGALRTDTDVAPVSGMRDLPALVHTAGSAGLRAELSVTGAAEVPDGAGLAVYRIVQEAITNVVKHAGATSCRVVVVGQPGQVTVEVTDDGPARPDPGTTGGQGLIGMRERVALHGGRLEAGRSAGGGWTVRAQLDTGP